MTKQIHIRIPALIDPNHYVIYFAALMHVLGM